VNLKEITKEIMKNRDAKLHKMTLKEITKVHIKLGIHCSKRGEKCQPV